MPDTSHADQLHGLADQLEAIRRQIEPDEDATSPIAVSLRIAAGQVSGAVRWVRDAAEQAEETGR